VSVPVIALGGAKSRTCIPKIINNSGASAAAASSIFIYQNQEKGVLINFPEKEEIIHLLKE
jgi:cyclase